MEVKVKIVGQSIIGKEEFIEKVFERYLKKKPEMREQASLRELHGLRVKDEIIEAIKEETGKDLDEIKKSKGIERNVLMDLLYRSGGLKGAEIEKMLEVDYRTVSQCRKKLRDKLKKNKKLKDIVSRIEGKLSRLKT